MDFASAGFADSAPVRVLTVVDHFSRINLALEARRCLHCEAVTRVPNKLAGEHGSPDFITVDNGSVFTSKVLDHRTFALRPGLRGTSIRAGYGCKPRIRAAVNDRIGVELAG